VSRATGRLAVYGAAAVLVRLADEGARVVLTLLSLQRVGSAALGGVLVAVLLVPHVLAAPVVGMLVDRSARPAALLAGSAVLFGATLAFTALSLGQVPVGAVVAVLLIGGCCGPALSGALSSELAELVPARRLTRAFGIDSLTYNIAGIAGPAVAAVLAGATSASLATFVLGCSAALGALLILTLPIRRPAGTSAAVDPAQLLAGVKAMSHDGVLATVTAATSLGQLGAGALPVILAVAATRAHVPAQAGLLLAMIATGGLVGSLLWTWHPARLQRAPTVVMVGLAATGVPVLAAATAQSSLPALAVLFALAGIANGPLFGALLSIRQNRSPLALRSQIFTLGAGAKITATAGGAALASTLTHTSINAQLALAGTIPVIAGALGILALRHLPRPA
jgi:MFS family permease